MTHTRDLAQALPDWRPPHAALPVTLTGRYAVLERLDPDRHGADLHRANSASDTIWDYLPYGPFRSREAYCAWAADMAVRSDPHFMAIRDLSTGRCAGVASYLRIAPEAGSIEVGHINLSPELQRTRAATDAMYLMMGWAFEAGYRRYEWKCNALNLGSRRAAQRLGFSYEGVFRQAAVVKGRNRDTAWFAAIDGEWPRLKAAFDHWLDPSNFDVRGHQVQSLGVRTEPVLVARDPVLSG